MNQFRLDKTESKIEPVIIPNPAPIAVKSGS